MTAADPGTPWAQWLDANEPRPEMGWRGAALHQFLEIEHTASRFVQPTVVSTHRSKSIELPVVRFECPRGAILVRDNFYGLNVAVRWNFAPTLSYADVYGPPRPWSWYLNEIERANSYIPAEKTAANGLTDPSWWWTRWSNGRLFFDGSMDEKPNVYVAGHCYHEGMSPAPLWEPGSSDFMVAVPSWDHARILMGKVWGAFPPAAVTS